MSIYALTVSGGNIYAGTYGGRIFISANNGSDWTPLNRGLSGNNMYILSLAVTGSNLFAGTGGGILVSTDNGSSWKARNTGLTSGTTYSLAVSGNYIFASTPAGVFYSTDYGNYWAEMNSGFSDYALPQQTVVPDTRISVYDIRGTMIKCDPIADNQIDVSGLKSGIYIIRFETENGIVYRRFVKQ